MIACFLATTFLAALLEEKFPALDMPYLASYHYVYLGVAVGCVLAGLRGKSWERRFRAVIWIVAGVCWLHCGGCDTPGYWFARVRPRGLDWRYHVARRIGPRLVGERAAGSCKHGRKGPFHDRGGGVPLPVPPVLYPLSSFLFSLPLPVSMPVPAFKGLRQNGGYGGITTCRCRCHRRHHTAQNGVQRY